MLTLMCNLLPGNLRCNSTPKLRQMGQNPGGSAFGILNQALGPDFSSVFLPMRQCAFTTCPSVCVSIPFEQPWVHREDGSPKKSWWGGFLFCLGVRLSEPKLRMDRYAFI